MEEIFDYALKKPLTYNNEGKLYMSNVEVSKIRGQRIVILKLIRGEEIKL